MSYFIAKSITITPEKIYYVGCDNNIYPHYDGHFEKELTWQNMRYLVNDLMGYCIQPQQRWWKDVVTEMEKIWSYEDVCRNDDKAQEAMDYLIAAYNVKIMENYRKLRKDNPELKCELLTPPKKEVV